MTMLPIEEVLPQLKKAFSAHANAVLVAPPGAGKTTRVPAALLNEPWLNNRKILMLEPRRLAAQSAARRLAASFNEKVGETVGYRVRYDTKVGPDTRIEVITEGVLTRLLQTDPALEDVGMVIFDEFHERSLHADLGLALCLQSQSLLRADLKILVMSATLEAEQVAALLDQAPIIRSEGRSFPVQTIYLNRPIETHLENAVAEKIGMAIHAHAGDLLVFLPGVREIQKVETLLKQKMPEKTRIAPLYGALSQEEQDSALAPSKPGERKIVLATSIAETSLTVEGIKAVIDSGLMRVPRYSTRTGMTRLETISVSQASADQRRGRAGRLGPGVCYRMWTEQEQGYLAAQTAPEIVEADLTSLVLELAAWGVTDAEDLHWLDPPPADAFAKARELLILLGALNSDGTIAPHGRRMSELAFHPRLAHMILKSIPLGYGRLACEIAALLSERDLLQRGRNSPEADFRLRIELLRGNGKNLMLGKSSPLDSVSDIGRLRKIRYEADLWIRELKIPPDLEDDEKACGLLLAFSYPDRIAQRRADGRFLLRNGRGAAFYKQESLSNEPYLVAAELDDQGADSRILLAAPVGIDQLEEHLLDQFEEEILTKWDSQAQAVRTRRRTRLGALVVNETPQSVPQNEQSLNAFMQGIREEGLEILPWTRAARQIQQRIQFMHHLEEGWPNVTDEVLEANLERWLAPYMDGIYSRAQLQGLNLTGILEALLSWEQRQSLDQNAPTHLVVPSGSRIPIDYSDIEAPVLAVRLQELFGLADTPRIAKGRVSLTIHLLSPAHRPVQVTRDLASFWKNTYFEVKKDLKGRYPKHHWPDDPISAAATNRAKPRM